MELEKVDKERIGMDWQSSRSPLYSPLTILQACFREKFKKPTQPAMHKTIHHAFRCYTGFQFPLYIRIHTHTIIEHTHSFAHARGVLIKTKLAISFLLASLENNNGVLAVPLAVRIVADGDALQDRSDPGREVGMRRSALLSVTA